MADGEQQIRGDTFDILASRETLEMFDAMEKSLKTMSEHIKNAGELNNKFMEQFSKIEDSQKNIKDFQNQQLFILQMIGLQTGMLSDKDLQRLHTSKELTDETKKHLESLDKQVDKTKQLQDADAKRAKGVMGQLTGAINDPISGVAGALGKVTKGFGPQLALALGAALTREMAKATTEMRQVARTGGVGLEEGLGMGAAAQISQQMRQAELSIPFFKEQYSTRNEMQQGAGMMFGMGGIRGSELSALFTDLPKKAYEAGLKFTDVAQIMTQSRRVFGSSIQEMTKDFDLVIDTAKELGVSTKEFSDVVFKSAPSLAKYGMTIEDVNKITKQNFDLITKGIMTQGEYISLLEKLSKRTQDAGEVMAAMANTGETLRKNSIKEVDLAPLREQVYARLVGVLNNSTDAHARATRIVEEFGDSVLKSPKTIEAYIATAEDLTSTFGMTDKQAADMTRGIAQFSSQVKISNVEFQKGIVDSAKALMKFGYDPDKSLNTASMVMGAFIGDLKNQRITYGDLTNSIITLTDKFNMNRGEIIAYNKDLIALSKVTGTTVTNLNMWTMSLADGTREMFDGPKEAMANAQAAIHAFGKQIADGKMTMQDYERIMRDQMDVMGESAVGAKDKFSSLMAIVERTGTRMSELSSWTTELSKINRQYGYEQQTSTALLTAFTEHIRSGTASVQDFQAIMKGPGGAPPGAQMAVISKAIQLVPGLSTAFEGMNPLAMTGSIRDIMAFKPGEPVQEGLREMFQKSADERNMTVEETVTEARDTLREAQRREMKELIGGGPKMQQMEMFKQVAPLFGMDISAVGRAKEEMYNVYMTGRTTLTGDLAKRMGAKPGESVEMTVEQLQEAIRNLPKEQDKTTKELHSVYGRFGSSVSTFKRSVDKWESITESIRKATDTKEKSIHPIMPGLAGNPIVFKNATAAPVATSKAGR